MGWGRMRAGCVLWRVPASQAPKPPVCGSPNGASMQHQHGHHQQQRQQGQQRSAATSNHSAHQCTSPACRWWSAPPRRCRSPWHRCATRGGGPSWPWPPPGWRHKQGAHRRVSAARQAAAQGAAGRTGGTTGGRPSRREQPCNWACRCQCAGQQLRATAPAGRRPVPRRCHHAAAPLQC